MLKVDNNMVDIEDFDLHVVAVFSIIIKHKFAMFDELKNYCKENDIPLKQLDRLIMMARL
ncbi:hypothetical protein LCGC14_0225260 [marine sediment metagenome]|uniref:Uncharacterized protein n=1 Tax=marine sediment metagenome TaxID=412755 RepID=A0A0F9UTZ2_9ZZZZ